MKNLILVLVVFISFNSLSQRDMNTMPYYFFTDDLSSVQFRIYKVYFNAGRVNPELKDKIEPVNDLKHYYDNGALVMDLNKDSEYMIMFESNGKTNLIHTYTELIEPKYLPSLKLDFTNDDFIELIYDPTEQYYLSQVKPL
jgi:hypothetical protein